MMGRSSFAKDADGQRLDQGAHPILESIKINAEILIRQTGGDWQGI